MSLNCNGSSQWISGSGVPGGTGNISRSVAFRFRTTDVTVRQFIFSMGDESGSFTRFGFEVGNTSGEINFNGRSAAQGGGAVSNNTWYNIVLIYDAGAGTIAIYNNGSNTGGGGGWNLPLAGSNFDIGRFYGGSLYFSGDLAEFAIFNAALSATDAQDLATGIIPPKCRLRSALVFYADFGGRILDLAAGMALTNNGSATFSRHPLTRRKL